MRFADTIVDRQLGRWAAEVEPEEKACAHNLIFEERLAGERGAFFEAMASPKPRLRDAVVDYYRTYVRNAALPHSFMTLNAPAQLQSLSPEMWLVRVESLLGVPELADSDNPDQIDHVKFDELGQSLTHDDPESKAFVATFVERWNAWRLERNRANPCAFSAKKDDCLDEVASPGWPHLLRNIFGLRHYCPNLGAGPIPVALMEYKVGDVLDEVDGKPGFAQIFCVPTVLDGGLNPQFFPTPMAPGRSPGPFDFGCPMRLQMISTPQELIAEVIHPRLTYRPEHMVKIGFISEALPDHELRTLRNAHLAVLRNGSGRRDFGMEWS